MPKRDSRYMEDRRQQILAAAKRVALRKGLAHTTLRDIAQEAQISLGAISNHFKTREDLVAFAADRAGCTQATNAKHYADPSRMSRWISSDEFADDVALDLELAVEGRCSEPLRVIVQTATTSLIDKLSESLQNGGASKRARVEQAQLLIALYYGLGVMAQLEIGPTASGVKPLIQCVARGDYRRRSRKSQNR